MLELSQHKFASNVIERCVIAVSMLERRALVEEVLAPLEPTSMAAAAAAAGLGVDPTAATLSGLEVLVQDRYGNYVVQKMLQVCDPATKAVIVDRISPHASAMRKITYGKHILARMEDAVAANMAAGYSPNSGGGAGAGTNVAAN